MVINEKALTRLMKEAYKASGYTVAMGQLESGGTYLLIATQLWAVEIERKNVPGSVIGLIAEHLKDIPTIGEAFQVKKGENSAVLYSMVDGCPNEFAEEQNLVHRTRLMFGGLDVWQMEENKKCFRLSTTESDLLMDHGRMPRLERGGRISGG